MSLFVIFSLVLGTGLVHASVLVPEYQLGSLYAGYSGAYAGHYKNYEKSYAFEYGVSDPHTGDHKNQWETKDKEGTVRGSYSLLEPDGTTRIVDYIADEHGFRAVVKKVGIHGTSVEAHGGAPVQEVAVAAPVHVVDQPPVSIIEEPVAYKSYDGGYEDYSGLKPVVADVYTKPIEYAQAPKVEAVPDIKSIYPNYEHAPAPAAYPKAEGIKVVLPQEYWSPEYLAQVPEEKYNIPQEYHYSSLPNYEHSPSPKYELPAPKYEISAPKYELPAPKYEIPAPKYELPVFKYEAPAVKYEVPAPKYEVPAPKYIIESPKYEVPVSKYEVPEYKYATPEYHQAAALPEYKEYHQSASLPLKGYEAYHLPAPIPASKGAYSYVQENRYNTPKGKAEIPAGPHDGYNLNVHYY